MKSRFFTYFISNIILCFSLSFIDHFSGFKISMLMITNILFLYHYLRFNSRAFFYISGLKYDSDDYIKTIE